MKTQLQLLIIFLLFAVYGANGQCPSGSIVFNNQTDIDNFIINYPNCEQIDGNVEIMFGNITNLNGLSNITSVNGSLYIQFNDFLTDISGLSSLENISGDFLFMANPDVLNLDALSSLVSINGYLHISANNNLNDITGLLNLDSSTITELKIYENPPLQICNLPNFCSYLSNPVATHPREIWGNSGSCIGSSVGCSLTPCPPNNIDLSFNHQWQLDTFKMNYSSCENIILGTLLIGPFEGPQSDINDLSAFENVIQLTKELEISNTSLTNLEGLNATTNTDKQLYIGKNPQLQNLNGLNSLTTVGGLIQVENNPQLLNIDGLESLTGIVDTVTDIQIKGLLIMNNAQLLNVDGLNSLTNVEGQTFIFQNPSLVNLDGLNSLTTTKGLHISDNTILNDITGLQNLNPNNIAWSNEGLTIGGNPLLSYCHLPNFCEYLSNPSSTHPRVIWGNNTGCEFVNVIVNQCTLNTSDFLLENNWLVYKQDNQFEIQTTGFELKEVAVYDMLGRKVYQNKANATSHTISGIDSNGLFIIKITTSENKILTKKVIN